MEISLEILNMFLYGRLERRVDLLLKERHRDSEKWIPEEVCILPSTIPGEKFGVYSTCLLKQGTEMGPFPGRMLSKYPESRFRLSTNAWEILNEDGTLMAYIDGGLQPTQNWLVYVQCARTDREQNLEVVQIGRHVHYKATRVGIPMVLHTTILQQTTFKSFDKDITRGEELLVWYGTSYTMYMGLPYSKNKTQTTEMLAKLQDKKQIKDDGVPEHQVDGKWRCVLCKRGFNSRSNLRSHMRIHTLEKPFICKFCGRKFSQSSTLRNHVRLHTGEKPYKCVDCKSSYSQLAGLRAHQRSSTHRPILSTEGPAYPSIDGDLTDSSEETTEIEVSD